MEGVEPCAHRRWLTEMPAVISSVTTGIPSGGEKPWDTTIPAGEKGQGVAGALGTGLDK